MRYAPFALGIALLACRPAPTTPTAAPAPAATAPTPAAPTPAAATPTPTALEEGAPAPDLTFTLHDGSTFALRDHAAETVFVYFYPKDDTPGCTVEAQGLRDEYPSLREAGVTVIGVSLQDATSHQSFIEKHRLPFALAVDDGSAARAFGVPVRGEFAARQSFLLKGGKVVKVWRQVEPAGHAAEVLASAKAAG